MPQSRSTKPIFEPPFQGLWLIALLYFCVSCLLAPGGPIWHGDLNDPDDYMYLDQVLDWLHGQAWFDSIQHRLNPPAGVPLHFSRLTQLPMAALILLFECFGIPEKKAAMTMALIEPVLLLAGLFVVIRWVATNYMPKSWAGVTAYVLLFSMALLAFFLPGHIDHHGLAVLLVALALGCAAKTIKQPDNTRWPLKAGFVLALAMTVALETLPWLICISAWLGIWATANGRGAARCGLAFSFALLISSIGFLLVTRPPQHVLDTEIISYSIVYVQFAACILMVSFAIFLAARMTAAWRWTIAISAGLVTGTLFLLRYPELVTGPMGAVDPALTQLLLDNVTESRSLLALKESWFLTALAAIAPLTALGVAANRITHTKAADRWTWGLMTALLTAALVLTVFYEYRFVGMLGLFTIVPLAVLLQRGWHWAGKHERGWHKIFMQIGLLLLAGPLPVATPALLDGRPVTQDMARDCHVSKTEALFDTTGGKSKIVMNTTDIGPELMFRTQAMPIAASFHENVDGNLDALRFFSAADPAEAEKIARDKKVDFVFVCPSNEGLYSDMATIQKNPAKDEALSDNQNPMIHRLVTGENVPDWLRAVPLHAKENYMIYEVMPARRQDR